MFDFSIPPDVTPVSNVHYFQEYCDKGRTPLGGTDHSPRPTHMFGLEPLIGEFKIASTRTEFEVRRELENPVEGESEVSENPAIDVARDARIALLVQKYEGAATNEDNTRLDILTQRLRKLSPRTTPHELDILTAMVEEIEQISDDVQSLRNKYGLK